MRREARQRRPAGATFARLMVARNLESAAVDKERRPLVTTCRCRRWRSVFGAIAGVGGRRRVAAGIGGRRRASVCVGERRTTTDGDDLDARVGRRDEQSGAWKRRRCEPSQDASSPLNSEKHLQIGANLDARARFGPNASSSSTTSHLDDATWPMCSKPTSRNTLYVSSKLTIVVVVCGGVFKKRRVNERARLRR